MLRNVLYSKNPHTGPKYWVHQFWEPVKQPMPILHNRRSRGDKPWKVEEKTSEDCHLPTWDWYGGQFDQNWPRAAFESGSEISWKNDRGCSRLDISGSVKPARSFWGNPWLDHCLLWDPTSSHPQVKVIIIVISDRSSLCVDRKTEIQRMTMTINENFQDHIWLLQSLAPFFSIRPWAYWPDHFIPA